MTAPLFKPNVLPPHLTMDEYCEFVEASLRDIPPEQVARQKALEERDVARFDIRGRAATKPCGSTESRPPEDPSPSRPSNLG